MSIDATPVPARAAASVRLASIDLLRGFVMALMLLDHTRTIFNSGTGIDPVDPARTDSWLFFTRWITHLCAPAFVLLAGLSARLAKDGSQRPPGDTFRLLAKRGLSLVLFEILLISPVWGRLVFVNGVFLQVIWAIGLSMIVLACFQYLPPWIIGSSGLAMIALHNLIPDAGLADSLGGLAATLLHRPGVVLISGRWAVEVLYPLVPWIGLMLLGYALGGLYALPARARDRYLSLGGLGCVLLFLLLRSGVGYGDPKPFAPFAEPARSFFAFLNLEKYPPSLLFLLATLGPIFLALPRLGALKPRSANLLLVLGQVPFFFYLLHLYTLAASAGLTFLGLRLAGSIRSLTGTGPLAFPLWVTYLLWLLLLLLLYPPCLWYRNYKFGARRAWTFYL